MCIQCVLILSSGDILGPPKSDACPFVCCLRGGRDIALNLANLNKGGGGGISKVDLNRVTPRDNGHCDNDNSKVLLYSKFLE